MMDWLSNPSLTNLLTTIRVNWKEFDVWVPASWYKENLVVTAKRTHVFDRCLMLTHNFLIILRSFCIPWVYVSIRMSYVNNQTWISSIYCTLNICFKANSKYRSIKSWSLTMQFDLWNNRRSRGIYSENRELAIPTTGSEIYLTESNLFHFYVRYWIVKLKWNFDFIFWSVIWRTAHLIWWWSWLISKQSCVLLKHFYWVFKVFFIYFWLNFF